MSYYHVLSSSFYIRVCYSPSKQFLLQEIFENYVIGRFLGERNETVVSFGNIIIPTLEQIHTWSVVSHRYVYEDYTALIRLHISCEQLLGLNKDKYDPNRYKFDPKEGF